MSKAQAREESIIQNKTKQKIREEVIIKGKRLNMGANIPSVYHNTTRNMLKIFLHICQHCGSQPEEYILAFNYNTNNFENKK